MSAAETLLLTNRFRAFDGWQHFYRHPATTTNCEMRFGLYLPPQAEHERVPLVMYLAGLTCNEETFPIKAGAQRVAAELGLALLSPDTSPRGVKLPGDDAAIDFGQSAGFYLDATVAPWSAHYRMYSYVAQELPELVLSQFPLDADRVGLLGHSMGGHGALTIGLRNPERQLLHRRDPADRAVRPPGQPADRAGGHGPAVAADAAPVLRQRPGETSRDAAGLPDIYESPGLVVDFVARQGVTMFGQDVELKF